MKEYKCQAKFCYVQEDLPEFLFFPMEARTNSVMCKYANIYSNTTGNCSRWLDIITKVMFHELNEEQRKCFIENYPGECT